jgi:phage-related minor tail protein
VGLGVAAFKLGDNFNSAYDKIRVATGATGERLTGLEADFKQVFTSVPTDMESASTAVASLNQSLGLTGDQLQQRSEQLLNLSRITKTDVNTNVKEAADLFKNWNVSTAEQGNALDNIFRASQASGVGFEKLSEEVTTNGVKLRELGFDLNESTALMATLGKAGVDSSAVMPALSKALATAGKEGKNAGTLLEDTFNKIKNAKTATQATADAMAVFGAKGGPQLAGLIREGKLSLDQMEQAIKNNHDTINTAAKDTEHFGEKWTEFTNKLQVALEPLASGVFDRVSEAMGKISDAAQPLINEWGPKLKDTFQSIGTWFESHRELLDAIGVVVGVVLVGAFAALAVAAWTALAPILAFALPFIAVGAAIGAVAAAVIWAWNNFEGFRNVVNGVVTWLKTNVPPAFEAVRAAVMTAFSWIMNVAVPWIQGAFQSFTGFLQGTFLPAVQTCWAGFTQAVKMAVDFVRPIIDFLVGFIQDNFGHIREIVSIVWDVIKNVISNAWQVISNIIQLGLNIITGNWGGAWDNVKNIFSAVWDTIKNVVANGVGFIRETVQSIGAFIGSIGGRLFEGLSNGFRDAINWIIDRWNSISFSTPNIPGTDFGGMSIGAPHIGRLAAGGFGSGITLVGEEGPELVNLPRGSYVTPAGQTAAMLRGSAGPPIQIVFNGFVGDEEAVGRAVIRAIKAAQRQGYSANLAG